ncbi:winged helix-turn-helix transcriptional regulator [Mucilaginibacter aquaedulcis]|uniref:winged helix-turn-helix transcriptional regulator n=1 Tax=Mucilaginibacter aquaedulcis TaxID=1187081 RepID=UPI0025B34E04|nr:helix-turn-helix domain-containing protein [Mucilaginibacter aquaedulcis]MDN3548850.1 helix-turn-helix domain-containing protein [Mucilaginibacter aquaedulcis]
MMNYRSFNPINLVVEIVGDKWTLLILRDIILENKRYFGEFRESEERISSNILADRLVTLEKHGLISKTVDLLTKQKVLYSLTEKGIDLLPLLIEFITWSLKYQPVDLVRYKPAADLIEADIQTRDNMRELLIKRHLTG